MQLDIRYISGAGFHFGRHGLGQEESGVHLPSDSLFAALIARLVVLRGPEAADKWIQLFLGNQPPFVISSAFPRAGRVLFFPTPLRYGKSRNEDPISFKNLKKIEYVSEGVFRKLLAGVPLTDLYDDDHTLQGGHALYGSDEKKQLPPELRDKKASLWYIEQRPRVTIGRERQNSTLYFTGRTSFSPDCGLWFAIHWHNTTDEIHESVNQLLEDLQHAGLGGERASGFGQSTISTAVSIDLPDGNDQPWVSLSRYLPHLEDTPAMLDPRAAYRIESVGGWVESPGKPAERRRSLRMLVEGSMLGPVSRAVPGQVVDVQPDYDGTRPLGHPVWRYGLSLAVGFLPGVLEVNNL